MANELSYVQTQGELFQALIDLYKAMGGGWVVTAEKMSQPADEVGGTPSIHGNGMMP